MNATIVGHSYIRRLKSHMAPPPYHRNNLDIHESQKQAAERFAKNLKVKECFLSIYTHSQWNIFQELPTNFTTNSDLLAIDFGSNDLANLNKYSPHIVTCLAEYIYLWGMKSGAKRLLFLGVLQRSKGLKCTKDTFESNRTLFNKLMKEKCDKSNKADYKKMRGFERKIELWSQDGIHPTYLNHYANRLRFHMMNAVLMKK